MAEIEKEKKAYFLSQIHSWSKEVVTMKFKTESFIEALKYVGIKKKYIESIKNVDLELHELLVKSAEIIDDMKEEYGFPKESL